jgi:hypothetical protein
LLLLCAQELLDKATQVPQSNEQMLKVPLALYGNNSSGGGAVGTIMESVTEQPSVTPPAAAGAPAAGAVQ